MARNLGETSTDEFGSVVVTNCRTGSTRLSSLNTALGAGLVAAGLILSGSLLERLDTVAIGVVVALLSGYNIYRIRHERLEHPDILRAVGVCGLWLVAVSLTLSPDPLPTLTFTDIGVGGLLLGVALVEFVRVFKDRPTKRALGRAQTPTLRAAVTSVVESLELGMPAGPASTALLVLLLTVPIGVGAGLGAAAFRFLMYAVHGLLFDTVLPRLPSEGWILVLPIAGAAIAGFLIHEFSPEAAGHGVPENMEAIASNGGRIRHRLAPFKVLVSALTLGSGGSGGREGPIARIGAGVGSSLGQLCNLSSAYTRLLLTAGIAAGIGATFGAPLGGLFFGLEIIMAYRIKLFNVVVLGSATAVAVETGRALAPHFVWFTFLPFEFPKLSVTPTDVLFAIPYGILMGLVAWTWVVVLEETEQRFLELDIPDHAKPVIGALPVGILGIWYAKYGVMGVGYSGLRYAVTDVKTGAVLLIFLAVAKLVATQFTIGSGGSGGVFAPTLYIGGLLAVGVHQFVGALPVSTALIGMVGMAAIFSGSAFAPLTAVFLVAEMFDDYTLVAVLAVPCLVSYAISRRLLGASIYTSRMQRKGVLSGYSEVAKRIGPATRPERSGEDGESLPGDATDSSLD